jgi:hypothetical protein
MRFNSYSLLPTRHSPLQPHSLIVTTTTSQTEYDLERMRRRRTIIVGLASLILHFIAFLWLDSYRQLTFEVGDFFSHATDVADLPRLAAIGFTTLGIIAVALGVAIERLVSLLGG